MENINSDNQEKINYSNSNNVSILTDEYIAKNMKKQQTGERQQLKQEFHIFGFSAIFYAIIYTICMYKNLAGIASTILIIGTVVYAYFMLKMLGYTFSKKQIKYGVILVLLACNLILTMDPFLHFVDYLAIIMIFISGVMSVVHDNSKWDLGDSVNAIISHFFGSLSSVFDFAADWMDYSKEKNKKTSIVGYIVLGCIITIPLLVTVVALLGGADAVFGNMLENMFVDFDFSDVFGIGFVFVGALLGSYAWLAYFVDKGVKISEKNKRTKEPAIMIVIGVSLGLVYLIFCGIQIIYLFAGVGELPAGYTYAEYAREGFTELMVVCLINLILVLIGVKYFRENIILKVVLTVVTACTYIMVASSAYRMYMYVSVYQLSMLRIWVLWTLLWLTFILTGALVSIYNNHFSLFIYSMIITSVLYIAFAYARPAYLVAKYNLSGRYDKVDTNYIVFSLNEDAASVVYDYYLKIDGTNQARFIRYFAEHDEIEEHKTTIRNFNISRYNYYSINIR